MYTKLPFFLILCCFLSLLGCYSGNDQVLKDPKYSAIKAIAEKKLAMFNENEKKFSFFEIQKSEDKWIIQFIQGPKNVNGREIIVVGGGIDVYVDYATMKEIKTVLSQ